MWMNDPFSFGVNRTSSNGSNSAGPDYVTPLQTFLAFLLWTTLILAIIGNVAVLLALANDDRKPNQRTKLFVGALSMSGLLLTFVSTWSLAVTMVTPEWKFGIIGCKVNTFVRNIYENTSACFLAAISVDR